MKSLVATTANFFSRLLSALVAASLSILFLSVLVQVVTREVLKFSVLCLDDIIPYAFSISTFAGAALLFREKGHIAITVISEFFPRRIRFCTIVFAEAATALFLLFFLYYGFEFWLDGRYQFSPLLRFSMFYIYPIVPLAGLSGLVFWLDSILSPRPEPEDDESGCGNPVETTR